MKSDQSLLNLVKRLNTIGIALSAERNIDELLHQILRGARELTGADGGTLYRLDAERTHLTFALVQNEALAISLGGPDAPIPDRFSPIPLRLPDGTPNMRMVAACAVLEGKTVNIANAYNEPGFDFSGTRQFDTLNNYRSTSFLTVPMRNHEGDIIAAIQLINKIDDKGNTTHFSEQDQDLAESLASQGAIALTNAELIQDLHNLFDSFTRVIANAIDAKSAQTGAHCRRVPDLTMMIAKAADGAAFPGIEDFVMTESDYYELSTAAWLHDCGKIVTPHHVVEKSTKLELITDGINIIAERIEIIARDWILVRLSRKLRRGEQLTEEDLVISADEQQQLQQMLTFLKTSNTGGEFMSDEEVAKIRETGQMSYTDIRGVRRPLLTDEEIAFLSIRKGTLSEAERQIMQDHMVHTINMLEQLPFPRHLRNVPEYAGGHHERMDGKGYPKGLRREQMSVPARMMGIADVFEALTAPERSYKKPMPLSQALSILMRMVEQNHLDPDLFALFIDKQVYLDYARAYLSQQQIDQIPQEIVDWAKQQQRTTMRPE
ncbi:HD family phosphohydrolase [Pseudohongiella spirulinae]|uniref:Phosphohydrolase n=1 Tax=Pseudohongiella spirulinae TaxID=1249552 RepID=A0A0S2KG83_9GAMM|nr:HD family phosphohydrolase [Pseudohongiella spirulinae]ALO47340.1 phosphohydrolase [Pseudohongiella spirulinae]